MLDDAERAAYEKRVAKDNELLPDGSRRFPHPEKDSVIRFLIEYAKCESRFADCVKKAGVSKLTVSSSTNVIPDLRVVYKHIHEMRARLRELENEDLLQAAREANERLLTDEECELNAKAVIFNLERLDRKSFGPAKIESGGDRAQVVYNIPSLSLNLIVAPSELKKSGEVIDVEPEKVKELV